MCIHFDNEHCPKCKENIDACKKAQWIDFKEKEPKRDIFTNYWTKESHYRTTQTSKQAVR